MLAKYSDKIARLRLVEERATAMRREKPKKRVVPVEESLSTKQARLSMRMRWPKPEPSSWRHMPLEELCRVVGYLVPNIPSQLEPGRVLVVQQVRIPETSDRFGSEH